MKKTILTILLYGVFAIGITGCEKSNNKLGGDTPLTNYSEQVITISSGNKSCIPVKLTLYGDETYELFTAYESCKPGNFCTDILKYTRSIKGKYNYDITKIFRDDNIETDKSHLMDNQLEYEIYMGNYYVQKGYEYYYVINKEKTNKYLDELLQSINVNLKVCAEPEYIN